jgi:hypothetical protein
VTDPSVTPTTAWTLLRERTFRRYWSAQTISYFGDQVSLLAMPLLAVLVLHASPADMGYLTAAGLAANLVLSLPAGVWVDRRRHRRYVMIAADVARALLLASIPVGYALGHLSLAQLYVVAFGIGSLSILFDVSNATMFVCVVPPGRFRAGQLAHQRQPRTVLCGRSGAGRFPGPGADRTGCPDRRLSLLPRLGVQPAADPAGRARA